MLKNKIVNEIIVDTATRSYPIYLGEDIYCDVNLLRRHIGGQQVMIVTNPTIAEQYLAPLHQAITALGLVCDTVILTGGELHKSVQTWMKIIDTLANQAHHRDTTLIALGGGVVGDIAGFAAATYQRGVSLIQIPTSLLAQVDASIGGKTAVNHPVGKNLIGAFHQPVAVIVDAGFLKTLPAQELRAGLAEIIKAALIADAGFFDWLEKNAAKLIALDTNIFMQAVERACIIKKNIVSQDEKETHIRALLNLGHTFGHALEQVAGYGTWLHGEAVAVGLVLAARLSEQCQGLSKQHSNRIEQLLLKLGLPVRLPRDISSLDLMQAMRMDKKIEKDAVRFIVLSCIGSAVIRQDILWDDVERVLESVREK